MLTPTTWVILALVLFAGWVFGLASHPGGRKWKDRYAAERDAHAAARKDGDIRATAAEKRVAELERENAKLAKAAPVTAATIGTVRPAPAQVQTQTRARPAYATGERRGWFDFGDRGRR